jgi:hypothetical protein
MDWTLVSYPAMFLLGGGVARLVGRRRRRPPPARRWQRPVRDFDEARWRDSMVPFHNGRHPYL